MARSKVFARIAISPILGMILSMVVGCGGSGSSTEDPTVAASRQQARISAYGKSGMPNSTGKGGNVNPQAEARRRGR